MGLDSLMSVELKSLLETSVGHPLPSTLTFNYPTIADLARYLDENALAERRPAVPPAMPPVSEAAPPAPTPASAETGQPGAALDEMSEDDLAQMLASKLSKLK
jgi:hypothetical protein